MLFHFFHLKVACYPWHLFFSSFIQAEFTPKEKYHRDTQQYIYLMVDMKKQMFRLSPVAYNIKIVTLRFKHTPTYPDNHHHHKDANAPAVTSVWFVAHPAVNKILLN